MKGWQLAGLAAALMVHGTAGAQMQAEVRGGLTVGSHSASAAALDIAPAVSFDVALKRQVTPSIAVFGGFFRTAFGCEEGFCKERNLTVVGNHGALGAEWGAAGAWLRAGAVDLSVERDGDRLPSRGFVPVDVCADRNRLRLCHCARARPRFRH